MLCSVQTFIRALILSSLLLGFLTSTLPIFAQNESIDIAKTYIISDVDVLSGDIISFDRETQLFRLSRIEGDEAMFGVVSFDPLFVLETIPDGIPIVRTGEIRVNVTTINGPIHAGDFITSSSIPGKAAKAENSARYIVGIALEPFEGSAADNASTTNSIRALLSIGTREQAQAILEKDVAPQDTGITEATILNIIQYLLAAFIAVGSIYIAFKNFGPNIKSGIVSIGRNPLAKTSIRSMVILNVVLIVLVSIGGLFVSIAILLLPI